jgi:putative transposase
MKKLTFYVVQFLGAGSLKHEAGLTAAELCRQQGITEQSYYRWKAKYGGMESGDAKKMKQLGEGEPEAAGSGRTDAG